MKAAKIGGGVVLFLIGATSLAAYHNAAANESDGPLLSGNPRGPHPYMMEGAGRIGWAGMLGGAALVLAGVRS